MAHIDFKTDVLKHYVRRNGWLTASRQQAYAIRRRLKRIPLRYFTFCAAEAVDVFMLEREGILRRAEETGRLEGVYFCEKDPEAFGTIAGLIGSPEQGFQGEFEKIVLFEDNADTEGRTLEDDVPYSPGVRRKLRYKDAHYRLREAFPFDIINLDVFGVMFPPRRGVIAPLLRSFIRILEWQTESRFPVNNLQCKQFTLFLTSHIDRDQTDANAIRQLANRLNDNINTNEEFRSAFVDRYGHHEVDRFLVDNFAEFFCLALPKFVIYKALFDLGWRVAYGPTYLYNRDDIWQQNKQYQIMHSVSVYERIPNFGQRLDEPSVGQYSQIVTQVVNDGVTWVDDITEDLVIKNSLEEDLSEIISFRDQIGCY